MGKILSLNLTFLCSSNLLQTLQSISGYQVSDDITDADSTYQRFPRNSLPSPYFWQRKLSLLMQDKNLN